MGFDRTEEIDLQEIGIISIKLKIKETEILDITCDDEYLESNENLSILDEIDKWTLEKAEKREAKGKDIDVDEIKAQIKEDREYFEHENNKIEILKDEDSDDLIARLSSAMESDVEVRSDDLEKIEKETLKSIIKELAAKLVQSRVELERANEVYEEIEKLAEVSKIKTAEKEAEELENVTEY